MNEPLIETFNIPITEWKTVDAGQKTIRIKGIALKGDAVSKNNRRYIAMELKKATNTWLNKPVNINHDNSKKAGHITWMDYDDAAELLTYEAEINKEPYVSMLRNHSAEIKGVSIQADYLFNRCAKCNAKFYAEEEWHSHMAKEHFVHDLPSQPHGIIGNALSLVLSPAIPGYGGTSVELAEMAKLQFSRLCEIITKVEMEKEEYMSNKIGDKAAVHPVSRMAFESKPYIYESAVTKEAQADVPPAKTEDPKKEEQCPEGEEWNGSKCVPKAKKDAEFPPAKTEEKAPFKVEAVTLPQTTEKPVVIETVKVTLTEVQAPQPKTIVLKEAKAIGKLVYEEEQCTPFEQCIKDGGTPEECAKQFKETVKRNNTNKAVVGAVNEIIDVVSKPIQIELPQIDESWKTQTKQLAESINLSNERISLMQKEIENRLTSVASDIVSVTNQWNKAVEKLTDAINKLPAPYNDTPLKEAIAAIKPYDDAPIKEAILKITIYDDKPTQEQLAKLADTLKEIPVLKEMLSQKDADVEAIKKAVAIADKMVLNLMQEKEQLQKHLRNSSRKINRNLLKPQSKLKITKY